MQDADQSANNEELLQTSHSQAEAADQDPEAVHIEEERSLLKTQRSRQHNSTSRPYRLWPLILAMLAAITLLWALFGGESLEKYAPQQTNTMEKFLKRPIKTESPSIPLERQEDSLDEDPCGMLEYAEDVLPFECLGADRQKSKAFFDACNEIVEEQGWSFAQLQACGMLEADY